MFNGKKPFFVTEISFLNSLKMLTKLVKEHQVKQNKVKEENGMSCKTKFLNSFLIRTET